MRISLRDIAEAAGVSKSTVGYVLRNQVGPSKETRERVWRAAQKLGYVPDARIASWMSRVRDARSKDLLPVAWLNTNSEKDDWQRYPFLAPYLNGVRERCLQLGYRLEEIWTRQPGVPMRRISRMLYQQGIEGVIVTPPARHIRLNWDNLAGVTFGTELVVPKLHRVKSDEIFNFLLALRTLRKLGYRRIGICLTDRIDQYSDHVISAVAHHMALTTPQVIPPLFYQFNEDGEGLSQQKEIRRWMKRHKPDVIIGLDNRLVKWVEAQGYRVPRDVGVVHLALDNDVLDWAGIYSNKKEIGRITAELLISLINNRQFGIPGIASTTQVRGEWRSGRTLLGPKPG